MSALHKVFLSCLNHRMRELQMNIRPNFCSSVLWIQRCWADWQIVLCGGTFLCFCRVVFFPYSRKSNAPLSKALGARTTGWPYSVTNWSIIDAAFSHSLFGLTRQVLYHVFSNPGPRKVQRTRWNLRAYFEMTLFPIVVFSTKFHRTST